MATIILADSRFKAIRKEKTFQNKPFILNIKPGSIITDHSDFVKNLNETITNKSCLFIISVGINEIPENIGDFSESKIDKVRSKIRHHFKSLAKTIRQCNSSAKIVIATIPPRDLFVSIPKYSAQSCLAVNEITSRHQQAFEDFVTCINETVINRFNEKNTGEHLPLHLQMRTHRGRRGSSAYRYHKLRDGLHPTYDFARCWFRKVFALHELLQY